MFILFEALTKAISVRVHYPLVFEYSISSVLLSVKRDRV